jgi:hypothetical protein
MNQGGSGNNPGISFGSVTTGNVYTERMRISDSGIVSIGGSLTVTGTLTATSLAATSLNFGSGTLTRRIVMNDFAVDNFQFFGFGVNNFVQRYQVPGTTSDHIFYAGTSSTTEQELFRVKGTRGFTSAGDSSITGTLTSTSLTLTNPLTPANGGTGLATVGNFICLLTLGTNGQVLTVVAGSPAWATVSGTG